MKPLRVLLVHRDNDNYRNLTGWWSYPVPEFTWHTKKVPPINFSAWVDPQAYDLAVLDDWIFGDLTLSGVPLAYVVVDSARSAEQLARNLRQARQARLILVDSDDLSKFPAPARRFAYAVNERLYCPRPKTYDVAFLCWPTPARRIVCDQARQICERHGWSFLTGTYPNFREYAAAIGSARVVIHKAHVEQARSWRVFDVMASRGALLSSPLPTVSRDGIVKGVHYTEYREEAELEHELERLLAGDAWEEIAEAGYRHVLEHHTWSVRAKELREMLSKELGL
ncbi:MAG: glycosyltransferase family 1 protein [Chloroflexota bacterium]|nr:MAG: glycosyltransferase family 1 protein [Chloroflexota bacterium]